MNKLNFSTKNNGDVLNATEWNSLVSKTDELVDAINNGGDSSSGTPTVIDSSGIISVSSKGNVTVGSSKNVNVEPAWDNNVSGYSGNYGDIALKPGDDIQLCSHHREPKKRDKIVVKAIDGSDNPVKMQVISGEIDLAVGTANNPKTATKKKDKNSGLDTTETMFKSSEAKTLDVRVLTGNVLDEGQDTERDERGYLKVRAQAIDLRCEKHGGIALQPKGYDSNGNMNKIKFEHGGGDGLEFATFNTDKTSIFTNEYRFNKDGIWKMATRTTEPSGKDIIDERENGLGGLPATGANKYVKQADDFYDIISQDDEQCTTGDIIKTAAALNGTDHVKTHITNAGNLEIETKNDDTAIVEVKETSKLNVTPLETALPEATIDNADVNKWYATDSTNSSRIIAAESPNIKLETDSSISLTAMNACVWDDAGVTADNFAEHVANGDFVNAAGEATGLKYDTDPATEYVDGKIYVITNDPNMKKSAVNTTTYNANYQYVKCRQIGESGGISLESDAKVKISAPKLTLEGVTGFGSTMTFGETDEGIRYQYKLTKKGNNKQCDVVQVEVYNNNTTDVVFNGDNPSPTNYDAFGGTEGEVIPTFCNTGVTVPAGQTVVVAQASMYDIIKLVNYMKTNNQGPWAA